MATFRNLIRSITPADLIAEILFIGLILALSVWLSSCSPAKQTAKQIDDINQVDAKLKERDDRIAAEAIRKYLEANPFQDCPSIDLDSLCEAYCQPILAEPNEQTKDLRYIGPETKQTKDLRYTGPEPKQVNTSDQPAKNSTSLTKSGAKIIAGIKPELLQLYKDSLTECKKSLAACNGNIQGRKELAQENAAIEKPDRWKINNWFWILIAVLALYITKVFITKRP